MNSKYSMAILWLTFIVLLHRSYCSGARKNHILATATSFKLKRLVTFADVLVGSQPANTSYKIGFTGLVPSKGNLCIKEPSPYKNLEVMGGQKPTFSWLGMKEWNLIAVPI